jgi:sterol desaturase/sphingolipid hydroxylase (fatty acid hydroxylase superfamily)
MQIDQKISSFADERRNARGEWRPDYPCSYGPLFAWPPRLVSLFKWLFKWGGYLWPENTLWFGLALLTWFYLTPSPTRCVHFHWDWLALIYLRNLILLWLVAGGWHLVLYTFKLQGTKQKYDARWQSTSSRTFLFHNQIYDNIFWSCAVGCTVWTSYEALYLWGHANGWLPYMSWSIHPIYCTAWLLLLPLVREFHFYFTHRAIHWKPLYKYVHYLHHKNINPGPWSGLAMHPVESILYFSFVVVTWIVPSHPLHFFFAALYQGLSPAGGHLGFEGPVIKDKVPCGSYFHYLHHRYFECNYGDSTWPFDRWFGTFRDGLEHGAGSKLKEEHQV